MKYRKELELLRKRFHTTLKEDLINQLKLEALKQHRDSNDIIEELLSNYFEEQKLKDKQCG